MDSGGTRRIELLLPMRTIILLVATVGVVGAFRAIGDTFLIVFVGIFLALVFEYPGPVRDAEDAHVARTRRDGHRARHRRRGLDPGSPAPRPARRRASATSCRTCPQTSRSCVDSDGLSWLGDTGAAENVQSGAEQVSVSVPDAISAVLGIAGDFFSVFLAAFTILFICLFLLTRHREPEALARERARCPARTSAGSGVWERVTDDDLALGDRRRRDRRRSPGRSRGRPRGSSARATRSRSA